MNHLAPKTPTVFVNYNVTCNISFFLQNGQTIVDLPRPKYQAVSGVDAAAAANSASTPTPGILERILVSKGDKVSSGCLFQKQLLIVKTSYLPRDGYWVYHFKSVIFHIFLLETISLFSNLNSCFRLLYIRLFFYSIILYCNRCQLIEEWNSYFWLFTPISTYLLTKEYYFSKSIA